MYIWIAQGFSVMLHIVMDFATSKQQFILVILLSGAVYYKDLASQYKFSYWGDMFGHSERPVVSFGCVYPVTV